MNNDNNGDYSQDIYSHSIKAGKRTYFLDIKTTKTNDHFITITESKKTLRDGIETFQKHKIFLYKEDFERFSEGLLDTIEKAKELNNPGNQAENDTKEFNFDDL